MTGITSAAAEVIPVIALDRRPIGEGKPGPLTARFIEAFRALANSTGTPCV
jgi:branched-chain amino acid aminotransferase